MANPERVNRATVPRLVNIRVDIHSDDDIDEALFDTRPNTVNNAQTNPYNNPILTSNTLTSTPVQPKSTTNNKLAYGVATPGTMPKIAAFSSPLDFFTRSPNPASSSNSSTTATSTQPHDPIEVYVNANQIDVDQDIDEDAKSILTSVSHGHRLGIGRFPEEQQDDFPDDMSVISHRIGILRPQYDAPKGDFPLSPELIFSPTNQASNNNAHDDLLGLNDPNIHLTEDEALARLYSLSAPTTPHRTDHGFPPDDPHAITPNDGIPRLIHPHTHQGSFLVNSPTLDAPSMQIRYALSEGKQSMTDEMRAEKVKPLQMGRRPDGTSIGAEWEDSFKIFILLMQPKKKIFELIQVLYKPSTTTVDDLLRFIPVNATEPALGIQVYNGLCRPQDTAGRLLPLNWMASSGSTGKISARILRGEILVAVPRGYSGELCAKLSKPILEHKRLSKLLLKKDPLGAPKSRRRKRKSKPKSTVTTVLEEADERSTTSSTATPAAGSTGSSPSALKAMMMLTPKQISPTDRASSFVSASSWQLAGHAAIADDESSATSSVRSTISALPPSAILDAAARTMVITKNKKKAELLVQLAVTCFTLLASIFTQIGDLDEDDEEGDPIDQAISFW
eukprot:CAMPEP_0202457738 /NCGR_PEP_ID=MMETSP1360-20130828/14676_1 /ASSEMBLY_ACC=CAM_ASM_000848 /TAXON_ID=515479 /ORGANISM="Licmophora paradoxa, Strain CCMP2313" /LENGTH=618 /DNA_ID=CAMNT_0049077897 /DNA_START=65 /DNA_END=1918 /DNA_ORIENTATION=+